MISVDEFKRQANLTVAQTKEGFMKNVEATLKTGITLLRPVAQKLHSKLMIKSTKPMYPSADVKLSAGYAVIMWEADYPMYGEEFSQEWLYRGPQGRLVDRDRDVMLKEIKAAVSGFQVVDGDTPYVLGKKFAPTGGLLNKKETQIWLTLEDDDSWLRSAVVTAIKAKDLSKAWGESVPKAVRELKVAVSNLVRSGVLKG